MSKSTCSISGCEKESVARTWCSAHYQQWRKTGDPLTDRRRKRQHCSVNECDRKAHGHGLCHRHYMFWRRHGDPLWTPTTYDECVIEGCSVPPRSATAQWCEMHYGRWRRNGHPEALVEYPTQRSNDRGYILLKVPDHPMAHDRSWVYEHRMVMFDLHEGRVPPQCEWCGQPFTDWSEIHIDHLNYDRADNRVENLRISCQSCNIGRHEGCDLETWAISMATRRILRLHGDQFVAEVERLKDELGHVPSNPSSESSRQSAKRNAATTTYQKLTADLAL